MRSTLRSTSKRTLPESLRLSTPNCAICLAISATLGGTKSTCVTTYSSLADCCCPTRAPARAMMATAAGGKTKTSFDIRLLLPVEPAFPDRFADDVSVDGLHHVGAPGFRAQVELGIEREQFERVMMFGRGRRSAWAHVGVGSAQILGLNPAVGYRGPFLDPFFQAGGRSGN